MDGGGHERFLLTAFRFPLALIAAIGRALDGGFLAPDRTAQGANASPDRGCCPGVTPRMHPAHSGTKHRSGLPKIFESEGTVASPRAFSFRHSKGTPMNWNQIEEKWAAMARRVRSDLPDTIHGGPEDPAATPPGDLPDPPLPEIEEVTAV